MGLEQRGVLEETAFLQQDGTEGTTVLPAPVHSPWGDGAPLAALGAALDALLLLSKRPVVVRCFLPRRATAEPWVVATVGAQRHLLHPLPCLQGLPGLKNGGQSPLPIQLWVIMGWA